MKKCFILGIFSLILSTKIFYPKGGGGVWQITLFTRWGLEAYFWFIHHGRKCNKFEFFRRHVNKNSLFLWIINPWHPPPFPLSKLDVSGVSIATSWFFCMERRQIIIASLQFLVFRCIDLNNDHKTVTSKVINHFFYSKKHYGNYKVCKNNIYM